MNTYIGNDYITNINKQIVKTNKESIEEAVKRIRVKNKLDAICSMGFIYGGSIYRGSGWFYRRNSKIYLITCGHNVDTPTSFSDSASDDGQVNDLLYIHVANVNGTGKDRIFQVKVIGVDFKGDFAVCEILNHTGSNSEFTENWTG